MSWRAALSRRRGCGGRSRPTWLLIFILSSPGRPPLPSQLSDKQGHSLGYLGLAVTVGRALAGGWRRVRPCARRPAAWGIAIAYGVSDEWHQSFVPGRTADIADWSPTPRARSLGAGACWVWGIIRSRADV